MATVLDRGLMNWDKDLNTSLLPPSPLIHPVLYLILSFPFLGGCLLSGEDPLAGDQNDHDMDSIAGVLKLYFRGLEHPLFPKDIFHDLMACVSKYHPGLRLASECLAATDEKFPWVIFSHSSAVMFSFIPFLQ